MLWLPKLFLKRLKCALVHSAPDEKDLCIDLIPLKFTDRKDEPFRQMSNPLPTKQSSSGPNQLQRQ